MFFDYCETGSWTEQTFQENRTDFKNIHFRQKVLRDLSQRKLSSQLLGQPVSLPLALSPVGLTGMQHADGEILAAKAAKKFGIPFSLSTMSVCSIEDVAKETDYHPFWFQLYMMKERDFMSDLMKIAKQANCSALILTADLQVLGQRHKDIKNGLSTPPKPTVKNILNLMTKPSWCWQMLQTKRHSFGNIVGYTDNVSDVTSLSVWTNEQFDLKLSWKDVAWVKSQWDRPLIIKGIMEVDDAKKAVDSGADAIVVSNHGGRQLDGAPSTISVLPEIVEAVSGKIEVLMDSGIRSGQDILKALALGANGVMMGRPYIYGVGAYGEAGVTRVLQLMANELGVSMDFCGVTDIQDVSTAILR